MSPNPDNLLGRCCVDRPAPHYTLGTARTSGKLGTLNETRDERPGSALGSTPPPVRRGFPDIVGIVAWRRTGSVHVTPCDARSHAVEQQGALRRPARRSPARTDDAGREVFAAEGLFRGRYQGTVPQASA